MQNFLQRTIIKKIVMANLGIHNTYNTKLIYQTLNEGMQLLFSLQSVCKYAKIPNVK